MSVNTVIQAYQQNNVMSADPLKLILMLYDRAIYGCRQKNLEITWDALKQLINSLNMEVQPIATRLLAVYNYCNDLARAKQFDAAIMILQDIRDTWASATVDSRIKTS
jgi:flagellin-specific chaperone FliS